MASIPPGTDIWATPAGKAPEGVTSNLIDPPTRKNVVLITLPILLSIAAIFVALRLYVNIFVTKHKLGWDDLALVIALPLQIAYTGVIMWMSEVGTIGRHVWDIPLGSMLQLPYWAHVTNAMPQPITGLTKLALLFFYLRIFGPDRTVRILTIIGIVFVALIYTAFTIAFAVLPSVNNPVVITLSEVQAAVNVGTDLFLFFLPISGIIKLKIALNRKVAIISVFSTGLAAVVMSCLTLYWRTTTPRGTNIDSNWGAATIFTVSVSEIDIGIMCGCMPLFAPLLPKLNQLWDGWSNYIRSIGSQLLRSTRKGAYSESQASDIHAVDANSMQQQQRTGYLELDERKPKALQGNRKHWFDRSIMKEDTTINGGTTVVVNDETSLV